MTIVRFRFNASKEQTPSFLYKYQNRAPSKKTKPTPLKTHLYWPYRKSVREAAKATVPKPKSTKMTGAKQQSPATNAAQGTHFFKKDFCFLLSFNGTHIFKKDFCFLLSFDDIMTTKSIT